MRNVILIAVALLMSTVMILTWGSVGSAVMGFGLVMMGSSLLYQRFVTNQEEPDFQMEE